MAAKLIEEEQAETPMTKTKIIRHEYGKEEIEVAACDSCGQEAKEEKMREFRIYDNEFGGYISGSICPSCRDLENPLEYPSVELTIHDKILALFYIALGLCSILVITSMCVLLLSDMTGLIGGVI